MVVGTKGTLLTDNDLAAEVPQVFEAVIDTMPVVKVLLLMAAAIVVVVEVPVNAAGNVQLYRVAPADAAQV